MAQVNPDSRQLAQRNRELSILNIVAAALNREVDLSQALHTALAHVAELLDLQTGWIWLLREESGESYLAASQNLPPALANNPRRMEGDCYCLDSYRAGDLDGAANINVIACTRLHKLVDGTDGLRYHASVPLYAHGKKLGVLNVASTGWRELSADDLRLLHTAGDLLSIAIERARLFAQSAQLGAMEERNRLAREIHDTLAQSLTAIALQLETADAFLEANSSPARVREAVSQALALTRSSLDEARRSVLDLRAAPLEGRTLAEAISTLGDELASQAGVRVDFQATGGGRPLPVRIEVGLYRIAQEALTNVARHAQAQHVSISLLTTPGHVELTIEDDGRGFDPAQISKDHYGLIGLNERAKLLGGNLRLKSGHDAGTRLEAWIPLEEKP